MKVIPKLLSICAPMATGYYRLYSPNKPDKNPFWCCVGTGMEDFAKVADQVFYKDGDDVVIAQWISSNLKVSEDIDLLLDVDFNGQKLSVRQIVKGEPVSKTVTNVKIRTTSMRECCSLT